MKKFRIWIGNDATSTSSVTLECVTPVPGKDRHDLVCKNEAGEVIAYFYTFLYWMEEQAPASAKIVGARTSVSELPTRGITE